MVREFDFRLKHDNYSCHLVFMSSAASVMPPRLLKKVLCHAAWR